MKVLTVTNWDRWQSYRSDRGQPPWIKIHREILRNPEWTMLSDSQRGHLVQIWILAADKGGRIEAPDSAGLPLFIQRVCCMDSQPDLQVLESMGFIKLKSLTKSSKGRRQNDANPTPTLRHSDAKVTPQIRDRDRLETETEKREGSAREERYPSLFLEWWDLYPKRIGKAEALRAWGNIPKSEMEKLPLAIKEAKENRTKYRADLHALEEKFSKEGEP